MTSFVLIDPRSATVELAGADEPTELFGQVGLKVGEVDHGALYVLDNRESLNIIVYEAGLFKGDEGRYFSIGHHLYEGGAIVYAADERGETVSLNHKPPVVFYRDAQEVEHAIAAGQVVRPQRAFGEEVTWRWPEVRDYRMDQRETELMIKMIKGEPDEDPV